jgi:glucuronate isomerase
MCNLLGNDIEKGMIPFTGYEEKRVRQMVEDICYNNAKNYFQF